MKLHLNWVPPAVSNLRPVLVSPWLRFDGSEKQRNPMPIRSKIRYVLVSRTGFKTAMVKPRVTLKLHCTTRTNGITSKCNQVPLQHCWLMYVSVQKAKQENDINPNGIREVKTYRRGSIYVKKKKKEVEKATVASKWKDMIIQVVLKMTKGQHLEKRCTVHLTEMATTSTQLIECLKWCPH